MSALAPMPSKAFCAPGSGGGMPNSAVPAEMSVSDDTPEAQAVSQTRPSKSSCVLHALCALTRGVFDHHLLCGGAAQGGESDHVRDRHTQGIQ